MGNDFETMVQDFSETVKEGGLNLTELELHEKRLMQSEAYWDNRHPENTETKAMVEAVRRQQTTFEKPREQERTARDLREVDFSNDLRIDASTDHGRYRRSQLLKLYGPRPGQDTPAYRERLSPGLRRLIEEEHGKTPKDAEPTTPNRR